LLPDRSVWIVRRFGVAIPVAGKAGVVHADVNVVVDVASGSIVESLAVI